MKILLLLLIVTLPTLTWAAKSPISGRVDPRIKHVNYSESDVYVVHGHYGYSTHIIFSPGEVIEHLSPGDSLAWQIIPKRNHLWLKPMENDADTNLSVLTNHRMYNFELRAAEASSSNDKSLSFAIKFNYPEDNLYRALAAEKVASVKRDTEVVPGKEFSVTDMNFNYTMRGSSELEPTQVFDDGEFTYFQFPEEIDTPAVFLVSPDKKESIVNFHVRGHYIVVQRVGAQFVLRNGELVTCVYNEGKGMFKKTENVADASALDEIDSDSVPAGIGW